jgi:heme/copper-type cytochrome/quinol oxidase subunit 3
VPLPQEWLGSSAPRSDEYCARLLVLAAAVASSFFFLSTHMHENHLLMAVALLLPVAGRSQSLAWLAAGCSAASSVNMIVHDLELPKLLPGGSGKSPP